MTYNKNTWEPYDLITSQKLNNIEDGVSNVLERITYGTGGAEQATEPIHTPIYINAGDPFPSTAISGDYVFVKDGDDFTIYEYVGVTWVKQIDNNLKARLTEVLDQAKTDAQGLVDQSASDVNAVLDEVKAEQDTLKAEQDALDTKAQGYADKALADAKADADGNFVAQKSDIDNLTTVVGQQKSDIDNLTTRVITAEGSVITTQNNVTGLQSQQTQTANQLTTEISDRQTGDSNTLTQANGFTTSAITGSQNGMQTQLTQTSNAILGKVGAANLFQNSEFEKDYGYRDKNGSVSTLSLGTKANIDGRYNGTVTVVSDANTWQGYWARNIPVFGGQSYSMSVLVHYQNGGLVNGQALLDLWFVDKDGNRISSGNIGPGGGINGATGQVDSPYWVKLSIENVIAPTNAVNMQVSLIVNNAGAGQNAIFTQPIVTATEKLQPYSVNDDVTTQLALLKDNWGIGISGNTGALASGIAGDQNAMTVISPKVIIDSPQTQIRGKLTASQIDTVELSAISATLGNVTSGSITNPINQAKSGRSDATIVGTTLIDSDGVNMAADVLIGGAKVNSEYVSINPDTGVGFKWVDPSGNVVRNSTVNELGITIGAGTGVQNASVTEAGLKVMTPDGNLSTFGANGALASQWMVYTQHFTDTNLDLPLQFTRQGNTVTVAVNLVTYGATNQGDQWQMNGGKVAVGYRPANRVELLINANSSGNNLGLLTFSILPDGSVLKTSPAIGQPSRMMGTLTYQTFAVLPDGAHRTLISDAQGNVTP